jgi:uncharacterized protein (TIGR03435 family)
MFTRLIAALALACSASAQPPAFEVASIKISEPITPELVKSGRMQIGVTIDAHYVRINKFSLFDLALLAYQVKPHQLTGPNWMTNERYDIQAKLPEGASRGQVPAMLQKLLADRFGMSIHRENRDLRVSALVVAKGGHHLKTSTVEESAPAAPGGGQLRGGVGVGAGGVLSSIGPRGNSQVTPGPGGNLHIESKRMTMPTLANLLNRYSELPVIDMTALEGAYEVALDVSAEEARNAGRARGAVIPTPAAASLAEAAAEPSGASLGSSLQKLGLKLDVRKAPFEVIVIDKAEKIPTEN